MIEIKITGESAEEVKLQLNDLAEVLPNKPSGDVLIDHKPIKEEKPVSKAKPKPTPKVEPKPEPKPEPKVEPLTMAKVRKLAGEWMKANRDRKAEFVAMLKDKFDVDKVPALTEDQFADFVKAIEAL